MLDREQNMDKLFREGLKNHEEEISASVWNSINQKLDSQTTTTIIDKLFSSALFTYEEDVPDSVWNTISAKLDEKIINQPVIDKVFKAGLAEYSEEIPTNLWDKISTQLDSKAQVSTIDLLFKEGLESHEEALPPFVWHNVSEGIAVNKRKKRLFFIRTIAAVFAIFLSFTTGFLFTGYEKDNFSEVSGFDKPKVEISSPNDELAQTIKKLVNNVKHNGKNMKFADASFSTQTFNDSRDNIQIIPVQKLNFDIPQSSDQKINRQILPNFRSDKNAEKNEKADTNSIMVVSSVMQQKNYAISTTYNPNFEIKDKEKSAWIVGGSFSPVFSFRSVEANENYSQPRRASADNVANDIQSKDFYDEQEAGTYSMASGVSIEYKTKNRWALQSGIYITSLGQANNNISEALITDIQKQNYIITTSAGSISVNDDNNFSAWEVQSTQGLEEAPKTAELIQNFEYLEVPMNVRFNLIEENSKISVSLIGGISTNVLLKNRVYLQSETQKYEIGKTNNINQFIYNSNIGIGMAYNFTKKISMNVEPSFKYSLVPLNKNYPIYYRPYYFTVFTGISYKF